jgi:hypothetical protein
MKEGRTEQLMISCMMVLCRISCLLSKEENEK